MKAEKVSLCMGFVVIILLAFVIIWQADIVGVAESRIEQDARESQQIESDWAVAQAVNEDMCAMLFYDEETKECTYSIYLQHEEEFSSGYYFGQGGKDGYMAESVKAMVIQDRAIAVMSMNAECVCAIVTEQGAIEVDPAKPFVVLLPLDCGEIKMYDTEQELVTLYDTYTG